jgi:hypothetical protein
MKHACAIIKMAAATLLGWTASSDFGGTTVPVGLHVDVKHKPEIWGLKSNIEKFLQFINHKLYLLVTFEEEMSTVLSKVEERKTSWSGVAVQSCHRRDKPHVETLLATRANLRMHHQQPRISTRQLRNNSHKLSPLLHHHTHGIHTRTKHCNIPPALPPWPKFPQPAVSQILAS